MHFLRLMAPAFGVLEELDTGDRSLPGLVVVEGRNEAGKSTFFELLCVLLYGFHPAARDRYPYSPWGGGVAEAWGRLKVGSEVEVEIHRRLLSTPRGTVLRGDREEDLRNRTVPWAEHVPRAVFRQAFALSLSELATIEGQGWDTVQDRLLGAMGASDLRPARVVADELEAEAGALWRPTRRGRQTVRELRGRIRELRLTRHEVREEDGRIRAVSGERTRLAAELEAIRSERERARVHLERLRVLLPVRRRLQRIAELEERAGPPSELEGLPEDVVGRLEQLRDGTDSIRRRIRQVEEDRLEPTAALEALGPADERLLARRGEVEARQAEWAGIEPLRARRDLLLREIRDRERKIENAVSSLLDRDVDGPLRQSIRGLSMPAIRTDLDDLLRAREALARLDEAGEEASATGHRSHSAWPGAALVLVGLLLSGWGWWGSSTIPAVLGALSVGLGIGLIAAGRHRAREARRARGEARRREAERTRVRGALEAAAERLRDSLRPLSPGPAAPPPGPELPLRLERLQEWIQEADDRRDELARLLGRIEGSAEALQVLAPLLPTSHAPEDPGALAHLFTHALKEASGRREAARSATRELIRLDRALGEAREEEATLRGERVALEARLRRLGGGRDDAGLAEAAARLSARSRARQLRDELERDHPGLEALRGRIREAEEAGEPWTADPDSEAGLRARVLELDDRIEELARGLEALDKDLEFLGGRTRLDDVDGEILGLKAQADDLARRRDRLWVLSRIVREAERSVREEHQPAVLQEASRILAGLTGGRYDRIVLAGRDGRDFRIRGPAAPESLPVASPLSTGTQEQVYLALRLATLDQLDRSGERLPLFLDEVLVNWDPERREAGLRLLAERSRNRQCFFFTCHPDLADRLEELGGRRLRLSDPGP